MKWTFILVFIISILVSNATLLLDALNNYETLNKGNVRHRISQTGSSDAPDRNINFLSHGKKFDIKLKPSKNLFSATFHVVSVDNDGREFPLDIDTTSFYEGYVENDPASRVTAHLEKDGILTATIDTADETYAIEPMRRHASSDPSDDMIVYRASDLKQTFRDFHDNKMVENAVNWEDTEPKRTGSKDGDYMRVRRAVEQCDEYRGDNDTCQMHVVADYPFCKNVGREDAETASKYMLQIINRVNQIYKGTCWDTIGRGIGVQVKKVTLHCSGYTPTPTYNANSSQLSDTDNLLRAFGLGDWSEYCLAHLFTYKELTGVMFGRAYTAQRLPNREGICSPRHFGRSMNSAVTTHLKDGRMLSILESIVNAAHQIGYNFGAYQDIEPRCRPGGTQGNYIMYVNSSSISVSKPNNIKFSTCSKARVAVILQERKDRVGCLKPSNSSRCGNGIVETGEECDEGDILSETCCKYCMLRENATCSDSNSICCTNCTTTPADTKICRQSDTRACDAATRCNGISTTCPAMSPKLTSGECILPDSRKGTCDATGTCSTGGSTCSKSNLVTFLFGSFFVFWIYYFHV